jgi:hypothetical protein
VADEKCDVDRLRALSALMREFGVTKLVTPDGYSIERPPLSPLEAAVSTTPVGTASSRAEDEEDREIEAEAKAEKDLVSRWESFWGQVARSSGAPIPEFPGPDKASQFLARHRH